ncbi:MAG TPA: hypothetical protein VGQ39_19290 [Pyrinomonadaceae bacterium]|jgi:hypothetical protein|nr:hypothetical protein [Pyrinomonadaceae bacterium]
MSELIQQFVPRLQDDEGITYTVTAWGKRTPGGTWEGWLEFYPLNNQERILRTERETTQPSRTAVEYWASGLEPVYFEGAFARAHEIEHR